jgi:hypothetical protein
MKDLNDLDPLPKLPVGYGGGERWYPSGVKNPLSKREIKEIQSQLEKQSGEDWQPYKRDGQIVPHTYINGQGKLKTEGYQPPEPPETDIPIPCVTDIANLTWTAGSATFTHAVIGNEVFKLIGQEDGSITWTLIPETAEPQTQTASQMEQESWGALPSLAKLYGYPEPFDSWIPHKPGDPMPCDPHNRILVRWADETISQMPDDAWAFYWTKSSPDKVPVIAWKPAT